MRVFSKINSRLAVYVLGVYLISVTIINRLSDMFLETRFTWEGWVLAMPFGVILIVREWIKRRKNIEEINREIEEYVDKNSREGRALDILVDSLKEKGLGDKDRQSIYAEMVNIYLRVKDYKSAKNTCIEALNFPMDKLLKGDTYYKIAWLNYQTQDFKGALDYIEKALEVAFSHPEKINLLKKDVEMIVDIYKQNNKLQRAQLVYNSLLEKGMAKEHKKIEENFNQEIQQ